MKNNYQYRVAFMRPLAMAATLLVLAACSSDEGASVIDAGGNAPADFATIKVVGSSIVGLGAVSVSNLAAFETNGNGVVGEDASAVGTALSDGTGGFVFTIPLDHSGYQIANFGGSYIDQSDQNADGDPRREFSLGGGDTAVQAWLPPNQSVAVLNLFTEALYIKALNEAAGGNFEQIFSLNRQNGVNAVGFDLTTVLPANPVAPSDGDSAASREYGMLLGGLANVVNAVAAKMGMPQANADVLRAVATDLADGFMDGRFNGLVITIPQGALPTDVSLNDEIVRFRNNNFDSYLGTDLVQFDGAAFAQVRTLVNQPPVAVDDGGFTVARGDTLNVDSSSGVLANDIDPEGNTLFALLASAPADGSVTMNDDGSFSYSGATTLGDVTFSYRSNDLSLESNLASVTITVINSPPLAVDDLVTVDEGDLVTISVLANDQDLDDVLTIQSVGPAINGTTSLNVTSTGVVYQHNGSETVTDSFSYVAVDGSGETSAATVFVTVRPVNDPPELIQGIGFQQATEGALFTLEVPSNTFFDADGDSLVLSASDSFDAPLPSWLNFDSGNGIFSGIPDGGDLPGLTVRLRANDGNGGVALDEFDIAITPVNDLPVVSAIADQSINEDTSTGSIAFTVTDTDHLADDLVVTAATSNSGLLPISSIILGGTGENRSVEAVPLVDQHGTATVTLTVSDGVGSVDQQFIVEVLPQADAPAISPFADQNGTEDTPINALAFTISDVDVINAAGLTVSATSSNNAVVLDGNITFTGTGESRFLDVSPEPDAAGSTTITVTVSDGSLTSSSSFVANFAPINDAPTIGEIADQTSAEDQPAGPISFTVDDVDNVAEELTVSVISSNPALLPVSAIQFLGSSNLRSFSYTPEQDQNGSSTLSITVSDGVDSVQQDVVVTITAVNDAPVFELDGVDESVGEDAGPQVVNAKAISISAGGGSDESSQTVSFIVNNSNPSLFEVEPTLDATGTLSYTPAADEFGTATVTVTLVDDGSPAELSASQTFEITVTSENDVPSFELDGNNESVDEDSAPQLVANKATDISAGPANEDDQTVSFIVSNDNNGLFSVQPAIDITGELSYTVAADISGSAAVTVIGQDDGTPPESTLSQTFTITVNPVNDAPDFALDGNDEAINEDGGAQTVPNKVANSTVGPADESSQTVNFIVTNDNNGLFSVQPAIDVAGELSYTAAANANGVAVVTVIAQDDGTPVESSAPQTFTITINAVNDAPSFVLGGDETVNEDAGGQVVANKATAISAGPADEAGQTVSFIVTNDNNSLFSVQPIINATGELTYTAAADSNGSATVTVIAQDNGTPVETSASQTFIITITAVNDDPSFVLDGNNENTLEDSGAQTVAGKVVSSSAGGGADEAGQSLTFVVSNNNNALFSVQPSISPAGVLSYTPRADQAGSAIITVRVEDDGVPVGRSSNQTFGLSVTSVNDDPSFTLDGNDEVVGEDSGTQTVPNKARSISPGPANESGQSVSFVTNNDNSTLFAAQPFINPAGTLVYTPAANANGSAVVSVFANDSGFPGASSATQTFNITVNSVNDAPDFALDGNDETVNEDVGAQVVPNKVANSTVGPADEAGQTVSFVVTNDNNSLFSVQPVINGAGELSYTAAANANGSATITVVAQDDGTPAESSAAQTFTISVNAVNDVPVFSLPATPVTVNEDANGLVSIPNHATAIDDGDPEATQVLTFTADASASAGLFDTVPAVNSTTGELTFDLNNGALVGGETITVNLQLSDDGGTVNGGVDTSAIQSFDIIINAAPNVIANNGLVIQVGTQLTLTSGDLSITDPESGTAVTHTVATIACGEFLLLGSPASTFNESDIQAGNVDFNAASCAPDTVLNVDFTSTDPQGAATSTTFVINVINVPSVTASNFSPLRYAINVGPSDIVITNFEDESGNPADLTPGSGATGTFVHRPMAGGLASINDGTLGELVILPNANFFPNEKTSITYTAQITDTRAIPIDYVVHQFRAATGGSGDGNLVVRPTQEFAPTATVSPVAADVDNDGDLDVILGSATDSVWLNDGTGNFTIHPTTTNLTGVNFFFEAADMNNDGAVDIIQATVNSVVVWINDGTGVFTILSSQTSPLPRTMISGDIDGDGDLDIVLSPSSAADNDGYVFVNDGNGNIAAHNTPTFTDGRLVTDSQFADFDNDGDLDAFFASNTTSNLWLNDGLGVFTLDQSFTGPGVKSTRTADLNGDSFPDVILVADRTSESVAGNITVLTNNGAGVLAAGVPQDLGNFASIDIGDMDADGDLDVVMIRGNNLQLAINDGSNNFALLPNANSLGDDYQDLLLFDVENDGDLDVMLVMAGGDGTRTIWVNNPAPVASLDNNSVAENSPNASVGQLSATLESGEFENFSFVSGVGDTDNALFEIVFASVFELTVGSAPLNHEAQSSYSVRIETTDGNGGTSQQVFTITTTDENDAPVVTANAALGVNEGAVGIISSALLSANDEDAAHGALQIAYTVTSLPVNGLVRLSGVGLSLNDSFTQDDIDNNRVDYDHVGNESSSDSFTFDVADPGGAGPTGQTFNITVTPVNDAPVLVNNNALNILEGATGQIANSLLTASDADDAISDITFTVTTLPSNGQVLLNSSPLGLNGTFSVTDIDSGLVGYQHDGSDLASDSFGFSVTDPGGAGPTGQTFNINVTLVNDVPVFSLPGTPDITVNQDSTGLVTVAGYASAIDDGDTDVVQVLTFTADVTENIALFNVLPAIDSSTGNLSFELNNTSLFGGEFIPVDLELRDDGGTANGGVDTSPVQSFNIIVNAVPVVNVNAGIVVGADDFRLVTNSEFSVTDPESGTDVTHTVATPSCGSFFVLGSPASSFTQADINAGNVEFDTLGCLGGTVINVNISSADPQGAAVSSVFVVTVASVTPVGFLPALNATNVAAASVVSTNFVDESANPADLNPGSGAVGTFVHRQMTGDSPTVSDGTLGELSITFGVNLHPNEVVSITYTGLIEDSRGIRSSHLVQQFRGISDGPTGPGAGTLVHKPELEFGLGAAQAPLGVDVDNDGDLDAVIGDLSDSVWLNDGLGTFTAHTVNTNFGTGTFLLEAADMNNDGAIDILRATSNAVQVWLNDGAGAFTLSNSQTIPAPIKMISGDIDADGDLDVIVAPSGVVSEDGFVFENDGAGVIAPHIVPSFGSNRSISDMQFADFDNDGDLDIYTASSDTHNIWSNDGLGVFARTQFLTSQFTSKALVADLDADGFQDVILLVRQGGTNAVGDIRVLINDGTGQLVIGTEQDIGDFDKAFIGDMDADGDMDVVVMRGLDLHVVLNDGLNSFTLQASANSTGQSYRDFALFDIDGDRDLDVLMITGFGTRQQNIWTNGGQ